MFRPIGHVAMVHLDLNITNFGIQEFTPFNDAEHAIFKGLPEMRGGYYYANDKPGWGIEIDEAEAAKHPFRHRSAEWRLGRDPPAGRADHQTVEPFRPLPTFAGKGGPGSRG